MVRGYFSLVNCTTTDFIHNSAFYPKSNAKIDQISAIRLKFYPIAKLHLSSLQP